MQVKCTNPGSKAVRPSAFPGVEVRFSKNGYAIVADDVGKFLVRKYPAIVENITAKSKRSAKTTVNAPVATTAVDTETKANSAETHNKEGE